MTLLCISSNTANPDCYNVANAFIKRMDVKSLDGFDGGAMFDYSDNTLKKGFEVKNMMWFQYSRKTNAFCTVIFAAAFINLVLQCVWIIDFFDKEVELFQCAGLHYGQVASVDSIMMIILSAVVMLSADNYLKYINQVIYYAIVLYQFLKTILQLCLFYDGIYSATLLYAVFQPLPFLIFLILNKLKKCRYI